MTRPQPYEVVRRGERHHERPAFHFRPGPSGHVAGAQTETRATEQTVVARDQGLAAELESLQSLRLEELRAKYIDVKGAPLPKHLRRPFALMVVLHAIREKILGGLSREAQKRLDQLVALIVPSGEAPPPKQPMRKVKAGTRLLRDWKGEVHEVVVAPDGFIWKGARHRSLSAIARAITGARWNGWTFFGVGAPTGAVTTAARRIGGLATAAATRAGRSARNAPSRTTEPADA